MSPASRKTAFQAKILASGLLFSLSAALFSQRIVSLAPGITEIVFALGKGGSLVGVTKFCDYPAAAQKVPKVGGFLDFNMEMLVALAPDVVIAYPEHAGMIASLQQRARIVLVRHRRLSDLLQSIAAIGRALDAGAESRRLIASIQARLRLVARRVRGRKRVRAVIVAGRNADELKNMYIVGGNDFLNDVLVIAGGVNAYQGEIDYPSVSLESLIFLKPEFIFEISAHYEGISAERILSLWGPYTMIPAVAKRQIRIITDTYWLRPGPRVAQIAEELAGLFAPGGDAR